MTTLSLFGQETFAAKVQKKQMILAPFSKTFTTNFWGDIAFCILAFVLYASVRVGQNMSWKANKS